MHLAIPITKHRPLLRGGSIGVDMTKVMLIDGTHVEEKRVAIVNNLKLEEFDYETTTKQQFKGNIYLAKVIRVEPSLQAAFVEYGGNRHGFLAFSEIHPDYYRIPVADQPQEVEASEREEEPKPSSPETDGEESKTLSDPEDTEDLEVLGGGEEETERSHHQSHRPLRGYKIQDVIKRRQIMLVQVVKEERSAKGAALTTYLSLAGRYCVLMPNAEREGGVSRKITNATDRKRLKGMIDDLEIPESMGVIIRTAGMERSKIEIRRDFEYLVRLWNEIREKTLESTAPALIHQEGDLIKRAIRDLYSNDIEEVWVEGNEGYKAAKNFMKTLMPSHAKKIHLYENQTLSLFHHHKVEAMIDAIHSPTVQLRSGGYIVINPTEALVAIDINSGRATRERHIEETAFKTNLEAAEEIALQLRLRDLAGLIVIDFIDMEDNKNIHAVERRLKESMAEDRARIQIGRISPFGLLELSRQRLRPSIIEASTMTCPHCEGLGHVRSTESSALHVLRAMEEEAQFIKDLTFNLKVPTAVAFYLLNQKRTAILSLEARYNLKIIIEPDDSLLAPNFTLDYPGRQESVKKLKKEQSAHEQEVRRNSRKRPERGERRTASPHSSEEEAETREGALQETSAPETAEPSEGRPRGENGEGERRRRRRRRRRGGTPREGGEGTVTPAFHEASTPAPLGELSSAEGAFGRSESSPVEPPQAPQKSPRPPRRLRSERSSGGEAATPARPVEMSAPSEAAPPIPEEKPAKAKAVRKVPVKKMKEEITEAAQAPQVIPEDPTQVTPAPRKGRALKAKKGTASEPSTELLQPKGEPLNLAPEGTPPAPSKGARSGWWKRLLDNE